LIQSGCAERADAYPCQICLANGLDANIAVSTISIYTHEKEVVLPPVVAGARKGADAHMVRAGVQDSIDDDHVGEQKRGDCFVFMEKAGEVTGG